MILESESQIEINQEKVDHVIGEAEKETSEKGTFRIKLLRTIH